MPNQVAEQVAQTLGLQLRSLKEYTFNQLTFEWLDMDLHNKANIGDWLDKALPIVNESYDAAVDVTAAFADIQLGLLLDDPEYQGKPISPGEIKKLLRYGVPPEEVYARPFVDFWRSLKNGRSIDDALRSGSSRLGELIDTDLERLSDFTSMEKFANANGVIGYRRVLVGPTNCALCVVASTQRYRRRHLKPIHPHCNCKTVPVLSFESDGDQILDEDRLEQIHKSVREKFGIDDRSARAIDYRRIMVTHQHGEIGPYLSWRGQHFADASVLS